MAQKVLFYINKYFKSFMIVIDDHNGNSLYYKTIKPADLALARSVNYNCKLCCKLKPSLWL